MTESQPTQYPPQYLEGLRLFNEEEFYECHDVLEDLWADIVGEERRFYQGLIQASVALFHFGNGNLGGARKMYHTARSYLEPYAPHFMGLDLEGFLDNLQACFAELLAAGNTYPDDLTLADELIPRLQFNAS